MSTNRPEQPDRIERTDRVTAALALLQLVESTTLTDGPTVGASVTVLPDRRTDSSLRVAVA